MLTLWPLLSQSPVLQYFQWSPLVIAALQKNAHLISLKPMDFHAESSILRGLLTVHIRRGDFNTHCYELMDSNLSYQAFNLLPGLQDTFERPAGVADEELLSYYLLHCWPTISEIVERLHAVKEDYPRQYPTSRLDHVYLLTNGKTKFFKFSEERFTL